MRLAWTAACLSLAFPASHAAAHSLDFGVLRVVETDGGAELILRAVGHEGIAPDVTLAASGPCALVAPPQRAANRDRVEVHARCRGPLEGTVLSVEGMGESLSVAARVERLDGSTRVVTLDGAAPRLRVGSAGGSVFVRYLRLGAEHLAAGYDHLAFLLALLLLVLRDRERSRARAIFCAVSGFTLGHSATLALSVTTGGSLPSAPVEATIALSIVFLAAELARPPTRTLTQRAPALVAVAFGLLHGLGFAGALGELGWPPDRAGEALLGFNLGLELAQLAVVAVAAPLASVLLARGRRLERWPAYAIGAIAASWTLSRVGDLII